jgi:hypothetical protein
MKGIIKTLSQPSSKDASGTGFEEGRFEKRRGGKWDKPL